MAAAACAIPAESPYRSADSHHAGIQVHEIVLDNVPAFYQHGWVTRDQISTFRASANQSEVSGDLAVMPG